MGDFQLPGGRLSVWGQWRPGLREALEEPQDRSWGPGERQKGPRQAGTIGRLQGFGVKTRKIPRDDSQASSGAMWGTLQEEEGFGKDKEFPPP